MKQLTVEVNAWRTNSNDNFDILIYDFSWGSYNLDANFSSEFGLLEDTLDAGVCIGGVGSETVHAVPPDNGDWSVECSSYVNRTIDIPQNMTIKNDTRFVVGRNATLNLDLATNHLLIKPLAKLIIKHPAKLI